MTQTNRTGEQDLRLRILNTLLTTPHRKLEEIRPVHAEMVAGDPRFYVRLAAWYFDHGDVRDHKEMFVVTLVLSGFPGHRDVGLALLRQLPPYEVVRVLDFISGRKTTRKQFEKPAKQPKAARGKATAKARATAAPVEAKPDADKVNAPAAPRLFKLVTESFGLFPNPPR
jgi:hypothetical protein